MFRSLLSQEAEQEEDNKITSVASVVWFIMQLMLLSNKIFSYRWRRWKRWK